MYIRNTELQEICFKLRVAYNVRGVNGFFGAGVNAWGVCMPHDIWSVGELEIDKYDNFGMDWGQVRVRKDILNLKTGFIRYGGCLFCRRMLSL
mgnify:CR=1 FL=1